MTGNHYATVWHLMGRIYGGNTAEFDGVSSISGLMGA